MTKGEFVHFEQWHLILLRSFKSLAQMSNRDCYLFCVLSFHHHLIALINGVRMDKPKQMIAKAIAKRIKGVVCVSISNPFQR